MDFLTLLRDLFPFHLDRTLIAGVSLWALALYLGFSPLSEWFMVQFNRWFNFAERFMYTSQEEFDQTRAARESQNAFYASLFSIFPFLIAGAVCTYVVDLSFDRSWTISLGIIACMGCGVYELGRRQSE